MKSLRTIVYSTSTAAKLGKRAAENQALCERIKDYLPSPLDRQLLAAVLQAGTLSLFVPSPVWASRLRYAIPQLQRQLAQQGLAVEQIRTRILPEQTKRSSRQRRKSPVLSQENSEILRYAAAAISDTELSEALLKLSRHGEKTPPP
jgi:hypothetical protein